MAAITDLATASSIAAGNYGVVSQAGIDKKFDLAILAQQSAGTWTPILKFGSTAVAGVTVNSATWVRVGPMLFIQCYLSLTAKNGSGIAIIDNLPAAAINLSGMIWITTPAYIVNMMGALPLVMGFIRPASTYIELYKGGAASMPSLSDADFTTSSVFIISAYYRVG